VAKTKVTTKRANFAQYKAGSERSSKTLQELENYRVKGRA
jgi:hypothetical protein